MQNITTEYYNQNAQQYIQRTFLHNMSSDRARFLRYVPAKGAILDAGCGSGRDALAFHQLGYQVTAIDAAVEMVNHTSKLGVPAKLLTFDEICWQNTFDAIWCSASLLHVRKEHLLDISDKLYTALKSGGILFVSFKIGEGERIENGRYFHMMDEERLLSYFRTFTLLDTWSEKSDVNLLPTTWLKAIFRKI